MREHLKKRERKLGVRTAEHLERRNESIKNRIDDVRKLE